MDISTVMRPTSNSAHGISTGIINHVYQHNKPRWKSSALRKKTISSDKENKQTPIQKIIIIKDLALAHDNQPGCSTF
jgi:hypothetical protein